MVFGRRWRRALGVCPECGAHAPLPADERLEHLLDPGSLERLTAHFGVDADVDFHDSRPYHERLAEARRRTGLDEAVLCASGHIEGMPLIVAAMDFRFMGGSLGAAVGEMITYAAETALRRRVPLLIITASGGARMQEGSIALMQMAKTSAALAELAEAGILSLSLVTDPTFGGVAASFATLPDVVFAEPGARLGFAGRRVIEQTVRERLPDDFQTAEFLFARGFLDRIVPRRELRPAIARLLRAATPRFTDQPARDDGPAALVPLVRDPDRLPVRDPWEQVRAARQLDRPTTLDYFALMFTDFQELHGDRASGDCPATVGGTAWLDDQPVMVIGQQKGHTSAELTARNFGMPLPAGYRKAARLMSLAAKLDLPVITLIDTPGAYPGARAEEQGQAVAIANNLQLMASLPVPVVTVITGEGGSGGALALAVANRVLMFSGSIYSVISPEGCAAILWNDPAAAPTAAAALRLSARDLLGRGVVDAVVPEPEGGTAADPAQAAGNLRAALAASLRELSGLGPADLVARRRVRFRRYGRAVPTALATEETAS
jgi:acetyl-CoA carboxylase carboxyl transferase subunit beta